MRPDYEQIVQWMKDYFATYNLYAQDAATVHRMDEYFAPDLTFMPYMLIYSTKDDELLVQKHYLPLYELVIDGEGKLKIKTIRFFWEASPPEVDAHYSGATKGN